MTEPASHVSCIEVDASCTDHAQIDGVKVVACSDVLDGEKISQAVCGVSGARPTALHRSSAELLADQGDISLFMQFSCADTEGDDVCYTVGPDCRVVAPENGTALYCAPRSAERSSVAEAVCRDPSVPLTEASLSPRAVYLSSRTSEASGLTVDMHYEPNACRPT